MNFTSNIEDIDEKQTQELEQTLKEQQKELRKAMKTSESIAQQERIAQQLKAMNEAQSQSNESDQKSKDDSNTNNQVNPPRRSARIAQRVDAEDRESDAQYDWTGDDDEEGEEEEEVRVDEGKENQNEDIKTNVCFAEGNIVLYGRSASIEARIQKIKEDYIDILIAQLKLKVVLAKKIALFKFLSPHYIVMCCTQLDNEFSIEDYDLFTSDEEIIEYLKRIKYGESHIEKIRTIFPDLMD
eukprot:905693_1